jgi:anti-sigma regulatory factor (Ser/Thr protein kinase)
VKSVSDLQEPEPSLQLSLDARPESMPLLRRQLRWWLKQTAATDRELFEIQLAAAEAFANAIEHPKEPSSRLVEFEGTISDHTVALSVRDYGCWQDDTAKEGGGLGLTIIDQLMDSVVIEPLQDGTIVTMQRRLVSV